MTQEARNLNSASLLEDAKLRAHAGVAYAGEVFPQEAWEFLRSHDNAVLVDVRTIPEWAAGAPDTTELGRPLVKLEWKLSPSYALNEKFVPELSKAVPDKDVALFFLCRSGGRSLDAAAAMTAAGYRYCYNVTGGFEGTPDAQNQRGNQTGWKAAKLPWRQS